VSGEFVAEEIEGGGKPGSGDHFIVMKGAENDGIGCKGDPVQRFEGAFDPCVEVGLGAVFEFEQAAGDYIFSGGQRQVVTKVIVPERGVETGDGGCKHH
jgi:hypothetical protein